MENLPPQSGPSASGCPCRRMSTAQVRRVRKWERWEEASAGWAATGSDAVENGEQMSHRV